MKYRALFSGPILCTNDCRSNNPPEQWSHLVDVADDGCWLWTGYVNPDGYGQLTQWDEQRQRWWAPRAHRLIYELLVGPIPQGLQLDHLCHQSPCPGGRTCPHRRCVHPGHLEPVTASENSKRVPRHNNPQVRKTKCPRGHAFDEANTFYGDKGERRCRTCHRERSLAAYYRKKAEGVVLASDDPRHGTTNGYYNLLCRCDACRACAREHTAALRVRRAS